MRSRYNIKSDRYGYTHQLKAIESSKGLYMLLPQEAWMTTRVIMDEDNKSIIAIDMDGGPMITRGWKNDEIEVCGVFALGNGVCLKIKEIDNDKIEEIRSQG